jgi:tetratricopeptide (TPR) repeat protein
MLVVRDLRLARMVAACALLAYLGACSVLPHAGGGSVAGGSATTSAASTTADCPAGVAAGTIASAQGRVSIARQGTTTEVPARVGTAVCRLDTVRTGARSRAAVVLANGAVMRLDRRSALTLADVNADVSQVAQLRLEQGRVQSFSRKPRRFQVQTPLAVLGVRGTEFLATAEEGESTLTVFEGEVEARAADGAGTAVPVGAGSTAVVRAGQAPSVRTLVRPRDQVQWALYFPPVDSFEAAAAASPALAPAEACASAGDHACAFAALEAVPASARDARHAFLEAALLLGVGQVDEARVAIDRGLAQAPGDGTGLALRSVIATVVGDVPAALRDGAAAVAASPDRVAPRIALSYAQQAALDLPAATATLVEAVRMHPTSALARARLAELRLSLGESRPALAEATEAARLAPSLSRTQLVLGFVALARLQVDTASAAFARSIELDSADPLARLGLGLGKIRRGELDGGRADIETAVALSANDSVLRSYLGKAYFEEYRTPLDLEQFGIARELDPNDPTPYLYQGILEQSINRPVEGLRSLEGSIERNDNRAVYRSRLLLDQDRAARGTSQARIYNSLGFQSPGINEATASLAADPANAGAHRFLSDAYRAVPRREVARVSELLQAQMLQDTNINPTQPSVSSTNLNIATSGGPTSSGFSEFNALFERDRVALNFTGGLGNDHLRNGELVVSAVQGGLSASAGMYRFETDGFRDNNRLEHDIKDLYLQYAVTPELNVQAEIRDRHTERGDLALNFDADMFDRNLGEEVDDRNMRLGVRYEFSPRATVLLSYIRSDRELDGSTQSQQVDMFPLPPDEFPPDFFLTITADSRTSTRQENDADQYGALFIYQGGGFDVVAGVEKAEISTRGELTAETVFTVDPPLFDIPPDTQVFPVDADTDDVRAYGYLDIEVAPSLIATLGASYQDVDSDLHEFDRINPKLGVRWQATDALVLRAGYMQTVKPVLASNRTLEPSQVAGFNQLFDEADGTRATRMAVAADWQLGATLFAGIELSRRMLEQPVFNLSTGTSQFEDRDERTDRAYLNWTPTDRIALRIEAIFDEFEKDEESTSSTGVSELTTWSVPLTLSYFHPDGLYASLGVTLVDQEVERIATVVLPSGDDRFYSVDVGLGYRLPRRMGLLSLQFRNLLDEEFDYQDDSFRTFQDEPSGSRYVPSRQLLGTFTLSL